MGRIDARFSTDEFLRLQDVPAYLKSRWRITGRNGREINVVTVFRWAQKGIKGIRLPTVRIGGAQCVSPAMLTDWFTRTGNGEQEVRTPLPPADSHTEKRLRELNAI